MATPQYRVESDLIDPTHLKIVNANTGETLGSCPGWIDALEIISDILDEHIENSEDMEDPSVYQHFQDLLNQIFKFFTTHRPLFGAEFEDTEVYELYEAFLLCVNIHKSIDTRLEHYNIWYTLKKEPPFILEDDEDNFFIVFCNKDNVYDLLDEKEILLLASRFDWSETQTEKIRKEFYEWNIRKKIKSN